LEAKKWKEEKLGGVGGRHPPTSWILAERLQKKKKTPAMVLNASFLVYERGEIKEQEGRATK